MLQTRYTSQQMCPEYESNAQSLHIMHFPPIENLYKEKWFIECIQWYEK